MTVSVSVVIPAYNAGRYLPKCLDALCKSLLAPFEIIVVDDGSTDDPKEIAQAYSATVTPSGGRKGPAFARNIGAKAATGDVLLFIDSDVCVWPETLSKIVEGFDGDPELDA